MYRDILCILLHIHCACDCTLHVIRFLQAYAFLPVFHNNNVTMLWLNNKFVAY